MLGSRWCSGTASPRSNRAAVSVLPHRERQTRDSHRRSGRQLPRARRRRPPGRTHRQHPHPLSADDEDVTVARATVTSSSATRGCEDRRVTWIDDRPVLVAPDAFKGTFSAVEVSDAIAEGLEATGLVADRCPIADGGEGTAAVLHAALGGVRHEVRVRGPLGAPVLASFVLLPAPTGRSRAPRTAVLDMASASGLPLVDPADRDPLRATTEGTGELIGAAIDAGAEHVLVACGGSATVDGGAGALAAIDAHGGLRGARLTCLVDVLTPWERCAEVFGPQKGASAEQVQELAARLTQLAATFPTDPTGLPGQVRPAASLAACTPPSARPSSRVRRTCCRPSAPTSGCARRGSWSSARVSSIAPRSRARPPASWRPAPARPACPATRSSGARRSIPSMPHHRSHGDPRGLHAGGAGGRGAAAR